MLRSEKPVQNSVNKYGKSLGKNWWIVKKITQTKNGLNKIGDLDRNLWEKCGKIYTKKLLNFICLGWSFPSFTQRSMTTTIYFKKDIK